MMTNTPMRAWCAVYQWPGKKKFLLGTVFVRANGPMQEVERALAQEFARVWGGILPDNVERPNLIEMIPGQIWFSPEHSEAAA